MLNKDLSPLVELTRGNIVESIHFGAFAIVDANGNILANAGNPYGTAFLRSTTKPLQALPFIEQGGDRHYGFTEREIAIICASHAGTDEHVSVIKNLHQKIGITEENLLCGTHPVPHEPTAMAMYQRGEVPSPIRHNCSGKHTGMLAYARMLGAPLESYLDHKHPVQKSILQAFSEMCSIDQKEVIVGSDGCTAPTFAVPIYNSALAYARLAEPTSLSPTRVNACHTITLAMMNNPFIVGGPQRFDTILMTATNGRIFAKSGAEGFMGIGILPGMLYAGSPGIGIAIKTSDGDRPGRSTSTTAVEILRQLKALSSEEEQTLAQFDRRPIYNCRREVIGELKTVFTLSLS